MGGGQGEGQLCSVSHFMKTTAPGARAHLRPGVLTPAPQAPGHTSLGLGAQGRGRACVSSGRQAPGWPDPRRSPGDSLLPEETFDPFWVVSSPRHSGRPGRQGWASGEWAHAVGGPTPRTHETAGWDAAIHHRHKARPRRHRLPRDPNPNRPGARLGRSPACVSVETPPGHGAESTVCSPGLPTPGAGGSGSRWQGHPDLRHQRPRASVQDLPWAAPTSQVTAVGQHPAGCRSPAGHPARHSTTARHSCCFRLL